jgi:phenylalanyl-tRNA synthetase alpha chain
MTLNASGSPGELPDLLSQARLAVAGATSLQELDRLRTGLLGKSGTLTGLLKQLVRLDEQERRTAGAALNSARDILTQAIEERRVSLNAALLEARLASEGIDVTLPAVSRPTGLYHPIMRTIEEMSALFGAMGFEVGEGSDVEDDWFNFGALNIPAHHPARAEHDTFYLPQHSKRQRLLRTQTSDVQVITMLNRAPPFRVIAPGRTYRSDNDATHSPMFHQCEGIAIDRGLNLGHLKGCLIEFFRAYFGQADLPVRFRASYFPFTEPSMEADIRWDRRTGEIGRGDDWLEILGSGMVHPRVLANCGIDPRKWQGFAFGMGIERVAMLKYGIADLRSFYESDFRWLRHYGFHPMSIVALHEGLNDNV